MLSVVKLERSMIMNKQLKKIKQLRNSNLVKWIGVIVFLAVAAKIYYELKWYDLLNGVLKLNFGKKPIVLVSKKTLMFVTKKANAERALIDVMEKNGWKYVDQFGMGYVFNSEEEELLLKRRDFSFGYVVFEVYPKEEYRKRFAD